MKNFPNKKMEKLCWSLIEPHLVLHGLEEIACLDDSHLFFLRSSFESSVWRYFHALSSTVLACLESILLLPLLMRWSNQKAAVKKTSKVQLPCFELFHDSYCSGFQRNYLDYLHIWPSHLTSESIHLLFMLDEVGSNFQLAWEIFWIWVRWSKHLGRTRVTPTGFGDETDGPARNIDIDDVNPACHCNDRSKAIACFTFYSHFIHVFWPRCS